MDEIKQDSMLALGLLKAGMYEGKPETLQQVLEKAEAGIAKWAEWKAM
jgi:alpha-acetolactate decarboxylase